MSIEKPNGPMRLNSTQFPNILIDSIMPLCSPAVWKLLSVVVRQTYGWHKNFDNISLSQLELKSGLSNSGVRTSLDTLKESGLLIRGPMNEHGWAYKVDMDCDLDKAGFVLSGVSLKDSGGVSEKQGGVFLRNTDGCLLETEGVSLSDTTKETTKETVSKERVGAPPADDFKSGITIPMAATALCHDLSFSGTLMLNIAHSTIESVIRHSPEKTPYDVRTELAALYQEYQASAVHVKVSAKNWLSEGIYNRPEKWRKVPVSNGNGSSKGQTPPATEFLKEQRERREKAQSERK